MCVWLRYSATIHGPLAFLEPLLDLDFVANVPGFYLGRFEDPTAFHHGTDVGRANFRLTAIAAPPERRAAIQSLRGPSPPAAAVFTWHDLVVRSRRA